MNRTEERLQTLKIKIEKVEVWKEKYEQLKRNYVDVAEELKRVLTKKEELDKKAEDLKVLEEWKGKYGDKFQDSEKQFKKLTAERDKADKQLELAIKDRNNRLREINDLQHKLEKAEENLKDFKILRTIMRKIVPTQTIQTTTKDSPSSITVSSEQPLIEVKVDHGPMNLTDKDLMGKIAIIYTEGKLGDGWFTITAVNKALGSHGWPIRNPKASTVLDQYAQWGYLEKRLSGKRPEYKVKMSPDEAKAKGLIKITS